MNTLRVVVLLSLVTVRVSTAQQIDVPQAAMASDSALSAEMPQLALRLIPLYREADREKYLDNLFRLQMAGGRYAEAGETMRALRDHRIAANRARQAASTLPYEIFARAKAAQLGQAIPFDDSFKGAYRLVVSLLDDRTAANQLRWVFGTSPYRLQNNLREAVGRLKMNQTMSLADAVDLVRKYLAAEVYSSFQTMIPGLEYEDDLRRYLVERNVQVRTTDGATVCVLLVRPRAMSRAPALLNFTIYADSAQTMNEARRTASNGYVGVEGYTRGKACSPDKPIPIEHDGSDARAVIEWISRQSWSDGRVGMYGGSYEGFTQWAAAKRMPKALKALMPSVTFAPGIDFPMDGNVFTNYAYPWPFYTTNVKTLDNRTYNDEARWQKLNRELYVSGRAYRDLDKIDGTPNPIFNRWLDHPTYDSYWQAAIPYGKEFAAINIPVLTTTGYYDGGQMGALYYFAQHYKYNPSADHYLIVGPYDHISGQRGTLSPLGSQASDLRGYELDSIAQIDIGELRYQWFNYVLKGGPKPGLLQNKVNYEVMGANVWKHAPTLASMAEKRLRFHLSSVRSGENYRLREMRVTDDSFIPQTVNLADRTDVNRMSPDGDVIDQTSDTWPIVTKAINPWNGIVFVSDPVTSAVEISGLFSGMLDFNTNKKDFDFGVTLYELTAAGEYVQLSYHWQRASYAGHRSQRRLLRPNRRQQLKFESGRLTSRQFRPGSRLVVVLGILKQLGEQINYGSGKEVSAETIADAAVPLEIKWYGTSFIDIPWSVAAYAGLVP